VVRIKSARDIAAMRIAGQLVAHTFAHITPLVAPGVSTATLDRIAEEYIRANGGIPAYKGYLGFPATLCISPNNVICHGIPGPHTLNEGDIVGIDVGVIVNGWYGDACITLPVGRISPVAQRLLDCAKSALEVGIVAATVGNTLGDIGAEIQRHAEAQGFSVVREYTGHGIGKALHEEPTVHHVGQAGAGITLKSGMVFTIEPMINAGSHKTQLDKKDKWTVRTADGSLSAQFEHTIAIHPDGPQRLTVL